MKVSTVWLGNCSRIPRAIRPPCEYPENVNLVPNQSRNSFAPWFFKYYSHKQLLGIICQLTKQLISGQ